jgi:hypothetical protein
LGTVSATAVSNCELKRNVPKGNMPLPPRRNVSVRLKLVDATVVLFERDAQFAGSEVAATFRFVF